MCSSKEHALRAIELAPLDATLQHILGRWCFGVANISFIEVGSEKKKMAPLTFSFKRGIASALFASPPVSTFEEALVHFLKHEELMAEKGGGMIRNKIFVGDTLLKLSRKDEAAKYFDLASKVKTSRKFGHGFLTFSPNRWRRKLKPIESM